MTAFMPVKKTYGTAVRGISALDVERAADQLLRDGERPTVERIRARLGTGSPNTINPLLDSWWKRLGNRLDAGPAALHRLPETVVHITESLWLQALEEARRRALLELGAEKRAVDHAKDGFELRTHVLSLREGEMESRLRERERTCAELEAQLRALTAMLKREQKTREALVNRMAQLEAGAVRSPRQRTRGSKSRARLSSVKKVQRKNPRKKTSR